MYKLGPLDNNGQTQDVSQCNNTDVFTGHNMNNTSCSMQSPPASESGPKSTTSVLRRWRRPESHDSGPKNVPPKDAPSQPAAYVTPPIADAEKQMNQAGSYAPSGETSGPNTGSDFSMYVPQLSPLVPQSTARPYDKYLMQYGEAYRKDKNGTYYQDGSAQEFRSSGYTPPLAHSASQKCVLPENNTYQSRQSTHRDYSVVSYSSQKVQEPKEDYCLSNSTYPVQNMDRRVSPHNPKSPIYRNFPQQNYVPTTKSTDYIAQNTNYCVTQKPAQTVIDSRYANYNQNYYKQVPTQDPKYRTVSNPKKSSPPFPILEQRLNQPEGNYCAEYTPQGYYPSKYGPVMYSRTSPTPKIVRDGPAGSLNYPVHHNQKIVPQEYSFPNKYYQQNQGYEQNLYLTQMNQMQARLPHTKNDVPRDLSYAETNQRLAQKNRMYCPEAAPVEHLHYLGKPVVPQKSPKMVTYNLTEQRIPENVPDYVNLSRSCGTIQRTAKVGEYSPVIQSVNYQQSCPTENFLCSPPRNPPSYPVNYPRQQNIKLNEMPARNISPRRTFQENMPVVVFSPQHIGLPKSSPTPMYPPEYPNYPGYYPKDNIYPGVKPGVPQYPIDQTKYPTVTRTIPQQRYYGYPEHYYQKHADASITYQANVYNRHYNPQQNTARFETDYRNLASNFDFEPNRVDYGKKDSDIGKSLKEFLESWEDDEEIVANLPDLVLCNNIPPDKQKLAFGSASEASKSSDEEKDQDPDQPLYILGSTNISSEALPQYLAVYEQVDRLPDNIKGYIKDSSEDPVIEKEEKSSNCLQVPEDPIESSSPHDLTVNKNRDDSEEEVLNLSTNRNKANEEFLVEECSSASEDSENQELEAKKPESVNKIEVPKDNNEENVEDLIEEVKNNDGSPVENPEDQPMMIPAENSAEKPLTASVIVPNKYFDNASQINKEDSVKDDQSEIAPKICEDSEKPELILEEGTSSQSSKKEENKLNNNLDLDVFDFEANLLPSSDKIIDKKIDDNNPEEIEPISFENLINSPDYIEMKDDDTISNDFDANSFKNKLEEMKEQPSNNEDSELINSSASTPERIDQSLPENEPETEIQVEKITETVLEDVSEIETEKVIEAELESVTEIEQDVITEIDNEEVAEIEDPVSEIEDPVSEIEDPVAEIEDPASEIQDPVTELEEPVPDIEEPETKIEDPCTEIETDTYIEESVTEIETVTEIEETGSKMNETVTEIHETVTEIEETGSEINENVTEIHETATEIEETVTEIKPVTEIKETVTDIEESVTEIEEKVTEIEEQVTKIEETVTGNEDNLSENELEDATDTSKEILENTGTEIIEKDPLLLVDKPEEIIVDQPSIEFDPLKEETNILHNEETIQAEIKSEILDEDKKEILLPTPYVFKDESVEIEDYIEDLEDPNQQIEDSTKELSAEQEEIEEHSSEDAIGIHVKEEIVEHVEDFQVNEEIVESSTHFESTVDKLVITNVESIQDDSNDSEIQEETNEDVTVTETVEETKDNESDMLDDEYAHLVGIEENSSTLVSSSESTVDTSYKENSVKNEDSNNFDFSYLESCTDNICEKPDIKIQIVRETSSTKSNSELYNNNLKCILESSESDSDATKDNDTEVPENEIKSNENDISAEKIVQSNNELIVPETINNNELQDPEKFLETEVFDNSVENHEICETEIITSEIHVAEPEKLIDPLEIIPEVPENITEISESTVETSNRDIITETNIDNITENSIKEDTITESNTDTITNTIEETITESITETRTDTIKNTIGDCTTETTSENITKNTSKTKNITETITDAFEDTVTNIITETVTDTMEETITNTITHSIEETIPDSIIDTITETNPLQIVENLTSGSVILDESSSDENLIIPKDTQCILLYNEGERYVIIQQDAETAEIIPSEDLVSEIIIPEKPAEKEEILVEQVTDEEIIICEEGIEDWVQNEEIIDSSGEESEPKEDLESRIEETDSKLEEIGIDKEDTQENEATSIAKDHQKLLHPKELSETFINEERKYCYPQTIFQSSVEEKELFINPENPLTVSYSFLESTGLKRRLSYGDSSPKIDFKAPKRRYSTMDTGRTVKKPIINLEEISKNITEVLENLTKHESKLYIERLDTDCKVEEKEVKIKEKTKFYIDYEPTEKKYKQEVKEDKAENKPENKGIEENKPGIKGIVENKPEIKGVVGNKPEIKVGIIENKPKIKEGIVENKPKIKEVIAETKPDIKEGIVENKPEISEGIVEKPEIVEKIPEIKGTVEDKPEIKEGIVESKPEMKEGIKEDVTGIKEEITEEETKKVDKPPKDQPADKVIKQLEPLIKPKLIIPKTSYNFVATTSETKSEPVAVHRRSSLPKTPDINKINKTFDDTSPIVNTARLTEPIFPKSSTSDVKTIAKRPNVDPRIERPKDVPEKEEKQSPIENKLSNTFGLTEYTKNFIKMKTGQTVVPKNLTINGTKISSVNSTRRKHQNTEEDNKNNEKKIKINLQDYRNRKQSSSQSDLNISSSENSLSSSLDDELKKDEEPKSNNAEIEENKNSVQKKGQIEQKDSVEKNNSIEKKRHIEKKYTEKKDLIQKKCLDEKKDELEKKDQVEKMVEKKVSPEKKVPVAKKAEKKVERKNSINSVGNLKRKSSTETNEDLPDRKVEKLIIKPKKSLEPSKDLLIPVVRTTNQEKPKVTNNINNLEVDTVKFKSKLDLKQSKPKKRKRRFRNLHAVDEEDDVPTKQNKMSLEETKLNCLLSEDSTSSRVSEDSANTHSESSEFLCCFDGTKLIQEVSDQIRDYEINKNSCNNKLKLTLKPVKKQKPAFSEVLSNLDSVLESEILSKRPRKGKSGKSEDGTLWTIKNKVPKVIIKRNGSGYCAVFRDVTSNPIWQPKIRLKRQKYIESLVIESNVKC